MRLLRPVLVLWLGLASLFPVAAQQANQPSSAPELRREAVEFLKRAEATPPPSAAFSDSISRAAEPWIGWPLRSRPPQIGRHCRTLRPVFASAFGRRPTRRSPQRRSSRCSIAWRHGRRRRPGARVPGQLHATDDQGAGLRWSRVGHGAAANRDAASAVYVARAVRRRAVPHDEDLLRRPHQGSHPRIRRQRRCDVRL